MPGKTSGNYRDAYASARGIAAVWHSIGSSGNARVSFADGDGRWTVRRRVGAGIVLARSAYHARRCYDGGLSLLSPIDEMALRHCARTAGFAPSRHEDSHARFIG